MHEANIELDLDGASASAVPEATAAQEIFRILQEAIGNALKHSGGSRIVVRLATSDHRVLAAVSDNGSGFEPTGPQAQRHLGLVSMRERAEAIGGKLRLDSAPGAGTTVSLEVEVGRRDSRPDR